MALSDGRVCVCKTYVFGNSKKTTGVLYKQNKSNETIQRYESDDATAINPMPMDEMPIDIWFISSL